MLPKNIQTALENDDLVDISTTGRKTGQPYRFEMWFHYHLGRIYLTGRPAPRDWLANMKANPEITFHLKESLQLDIPATARPITDQADRRAILTGLLKGTDYADNLEAWIEGSPLVEVILQPDAI